MSDERVSCDLGELLNCETAISTQFIYSRYFVPVQMVFADSEFPILPKYKRDFLGQVFGTKTLNLEHVREVLGDEDVARVLERNNMGWTLNGAEETANSGSQTRRQDGNEDGADEDALLRELGNVTSDARAADNLLRRVGHQAEAGLQGSPVLSAREDASTVVPVPSDVRSTPRDPSGQDVANLFVGLLKSDLGYLFMDRTRIQPSGFRIGEHVFGLALAPGEEVTIEQRTFAKRQVTYEEQNETEQQFDLELASTLTTELQEGFERTKNHNDTSGLTLSHTGQYSTPDFFWGKINASHTIGYTRNVTDASQETSRRSSKDSQTASSKVAAKYRTLHKMTFKVAEETGFESTSKRLIRNPNRYTPITLHYFKILQALHMTQERYGVRLCWTPSVHDPAGAFITQLEVGRAKIIADAQKTIPPMPIPPPKPGTSTTGAQPIEERWMYSELTDADQWGVWGDQRADYNVDIPYPSDFQWDGSTDNMQVRVDTTRTDYDVHIKGIPVPASAEGGTVLRAVVHVGAPVWIGGPRIYFQIGARFTKTPTLPDQTAENAQYAAAVAEYETALRAWEDKRDQIMEAARLAADAWKAQMLRQLNPVFELINQLIKASFPPAVRDELWEIDLWQRLFDWEQASYEAYPSWWADGAMRDPTKDASDFINASWAKLYLPIRVGVEREALRWIFGQTITGELDDATEERLGALLEDFDAYRDNHFGAGEIATGDGDCPHIEDRFMCLAQWNDLMPTDGSHVEVIQGTTTAADAITSKESEDAQARRLAELEALGADTTLRKSASEHITEPVQVRVWISTPDPPKPPT